MILTITEFLFHGYGATLKVFFGTESITVLIEGIMEYELVEIRQWKLFVI